MDSINENQEPDLGNKALDLSDDENEPIKEFTVNLDVNGLPESTIELDEWRIKLLKNYGAKLRTDWEGIHQLSGSITAVSNAREFLLSRGKINPRRDQNTFQQPSETQSYGFDNGTTERKPEASFKTQSQHGSKEQFRDAESEQLSVARREEQKGAPHGKKNNEGKIKAKKEDQLKVHPEGPSEYGTGDGSGGRPDEMMEDENKFGAVKGDEQRDIKRGYQPGESGTEDSGRLDHGVRTSKDTDQKGARPKNTRMVGGNYSHGALPGKAERVLKEENSENIGTQLKLHGKYDQSNKASKDEGNLKTSQPSAPAENKSPIQKEFVGIQSQNMHGYSGKPDAETSTEIPIVVQPDQVPTLPYKEVVLDSLDCGNIDVEVVEHLYSDKIQSLRIAENTYNVKRTVSTSNPSIIMMEGTKAEIQKLKTKFQKWIRGIENDVVYISPLTPLDRLTEARKQIQKEMSLNVCIREYLPNGVIEIFALSKDDAQIAKETYLEKLKEYCDMTQIHSLGKNMLYPDLDMLKQTGDHHAQNLVPGQETGYQATSLVASSHNSSVVMPDGHQQQSSKPPDSGKNSPGDGACSHTVSGSPNTLDCSQFQLAYGIKVQVRVDDITMVKADVIVSPATIGLSHKKGIAKAIAAAAGDELVNECRSIVLGRKYIDVTQVVSTTGGKLCPRVYHAVGPTWKSYSDKSKCTLDLQQTVLNSLILAENEEVQTIAIPLIGSGASGFPTPIVAKAMYEAVAEFDSKHRQKKRLKMVVIITTDQTMVPEIVQAFTSHGHVRYLEEHMKDGNIPQAHSPDEAQNQSNLAGIHDDKSSEHQESKNNIPIRGAYNTRSQKHVVQHLASVPLANGIKVHIFLGDITKVQADIIVSSANSSLSQEQGVAKAIATAGGQEFKTACARLKSEVKKLECTKVYKTSGGKLDCKQVYHAVGPPKWSETSTSQNKLASIEMLSETVYNCLEKANKANHRTIAIPAIGTGISGFPNPVVGFALYEATTHFDEAFSEGSSLQDVIYITIDPTVADEIKSAFVNHGAVDMTPYGVFLDHDGSKSKKSIKKKLSGFFKSNKPKPDKSDICPICLQPITEKRKLEKCKHKFCEPCIEDHYDMFGMRCPIEGCNNIFGPLKGIKLDGATMNYYEDKKSLPGFDGVPTYVIYYDVPTGKQKRGHPEPDQLYKGTTFTAYLPVCKKGKDIIKLFRRAFDAGLTFKIVKKNGIYKPWWAGISHKTNKDGGPENHGYPDDKYLKTVLQELEAHGIK